jgi:hypothetical protein
MSVMRFDLFADAFGELDRMSSEQLPSTCGPPGKPLDGWEADKRVQWRGGPARGRSGRRRHHNRGQRADDQS